VTELIHILVDCLAWYGLTYTFPLTAGDISEKRSVIKSSFYKVATCSNGILELTRSIKSLSRKTSWLKSICAVPDDSYDADLRVG
jgi:hypothetical protein